MANLGLMAQLELLSRDRPDRVLRLRGQWQGVGGTAEAFELVMYRGFSSSTTHPTAYDPDQPLLPDGALIETAELLLGPLNPVAEQQLAAPVAVERFLDPASWL
ncbi:hypothetical protein KBY58_05710 [Cyanobium sp. HWJ4-Hawea]|uniref:DUF7734 family protein n=1 Tax=unclassified Cyanobium TaxID=2627006 RepID=UPI0020CC21C5|nr:MULTISPECIES: hypothetical protein [unclassified Cyanobium]MCP9775862.1 hypothetical protein [Cyanobium sp. WAJ14-Wanaka]MCP9808923.1 hypothetical protein [Cyanobium sp. HWJ4-Hawea]